VTRIVATVFVLAIGACSGSAQKDDDSDDDSACRRDGDCPQGRFCVDIGGNRNEICEGGETCECAILDPSTGGGGGRAGSTGVGGGGTDGGTGGDAGEPGVGGSGVGMGCERDENCSGTTVCIDDISGDGDGFCEAGEMCTCVGIGTGGGGTSGTGGRGGSGGTSTGGTSGTGGVVTSALGEPCASDSQCGAGLICLPSDGLPSGDGPPNGLCTVACQADDECLAFANEAFCVEFETGVNYCILACTGGAVGAPKCRVRSDMACGILATTPTRVACVDTNDCGVGMVCFAEIEGDPLVCHDMLTACIPVCRADSDCATGQFCNFTSGFCTATEPEGLPIGALCDPTLPAAEDQCNGFCLATDETETEGTCAAYCAASLDATGCGWVGTGDPPQAGCLYSTVISRDASGSISLAESDLMLCGQLCDCNADCPAAIEYCMDENAADPQASVQAIFGRGGYCRPLLSGETTADSLASCTL
jgi:hypothetical protein